MGICLTLESLSAAHLMGRAGFDWALIDMEHSPYTAREATAIVHALTVGSFSKCASLIRVPTLSNEWVKWALDSGATGIVAPMLQSRAEAEQLVRWARYPSQHPTGQRSFGPGQAVWADLSQDSDMAKYVGKTSNDVAVVAMIESKAGIANAEGIMSTSGLSGIFIGPVDLRMSLGLPGMDGDEPEYRDLLRKLVAMAKKNGLFIGIYSGSPSILKEHKKLGFDYFLVTSDSQSMVNGATAVLQGCRAAAKDAKL
jgi:2-keto-3-deoxy-L-rhamnonate aldolase RhmA